MRGKYRARYLVTIVAAIVATHSSNSFGVEVRTVALRNQQAPGTSSPSEIFNSFSAVSLNDSGRVAIGALFAGGGSGIWSDRGGPLALVAKTGDQATDIPGAVYSSFAPPILNDLGQVAFRGDMFTPSSMTGIWSDGSGQLALVARTGQQAAGFANGNNYLSFTSNPGNSNTTTPLFNNAGRVAFMGQVSSSTAIWIAGGGAVDLVARTDAQASGLPNGQNYRALFGLTLNNSNQVAFQANYLGQSSSGSGGWAGGAGSTTPVVLSNTPAPGSGGSFQVITSSASLNDAGDVAFHAAANSLGGMWLVHAGTVTRLALQGQAAPGTPAGVSYNVFTVPAFMNNAGDTAFMATLQGAGVDTSNDRALWLSKGGSEELIARDGDHAAGTPAGVVFESISTPEINDQGQLAFAATLVGTGVDATNRNGIWVTDAAGIPQLVLRTGEQLEVGPGDIRTITTLNFTGNGSTGDGSPSMFNNLGQVAFTAAFSNGTSGVFVTAPIPEPVGGVLVLSWLAFGCLWRERR